MGIKSCRRLSLLLPVLSLIFFGGCSKSNPVGITGQTYVGHDTVTVAGVSIIMVGIPAGTFQMGDSNANLVNQGSSSTPVHSVTLASFSISQTLVTQAQYLAVMDTNPSYFNSGALSANYPVESVNWYEAAWFCNKLSKLAGLDTVYTYTGVSRDTGVDTLAAVAIDYTKNGYRLPTEAEFEYANRAGSTADYFWGGSFPLVTTADTLAIDSNAVWYGNSSSSTMAVASKKPNTWGLYDMSGNVWEWCNDWYATYIKTSQTNPTGPATSTGSGRVLRGGSWFNFYGGIGHANPAFLCAAYRYSYPPIGSISANNGGFRIARGSW